MTHSGRIPWHNQLLVASQQAGHGQRCADIMHCEGQFHWKIAGYKEEIFDEISKAEKGRKFVSWFCFGDLQKICLMCTF